MYMIKGSPKIVFFFFFFAARITELSAQCKSAKSQADLAKQELKEYKEKATRILQVYKRS